MACPTVRKCRASCLHRQMVEEFYLVREATDQACEAATLGYATEAAAWRRDNGMTFHQWLTRGGWTAYTRAEPA